MEPNFDFISDSMDINEQVKIWKEEYIKLFNSIQQERTEWTKRDEKRIILIKQYKEENEKMSKANKLTMRLVENLKKQIEKYQKNDTFNVNNDELNEKSKQDVDNWKTRYVTEKRTSEYLRAECEDLQIEIEELKDTNNNTSINIINEAWEKEVTTLIQSTEQIEEQKINYKSLYQELVKDKMKLVNKTSQEIQHLRQIIYSQNTTVYKNIFDRIARYHNLNGGDEDTLFQLIIDAQLQNKK
eukprot:67775_1